MALLQLLEEAQAAVSRDRAGFLQAAARMMINCEQSALLGVPDKAVCSDLKSVASSFIIICTTLVFIK